MLTLALPLLALLACQRDDGDLCTDPASEEVEVLCTIDQVSSLAQAGQVDEALALCPDLPEGRWRGECNFQIAEALSLGGQLERGLEVCTDAAGFAQMCLGHMLWLRSDSLVDRTPADTDVQAEVDRFVASLPHLGLVGASLPDVARAAAWHGVYAGSGSADPTAARAATGDHAPHARGAFAWEAVRLLGTRQPTAETVDAVWATWEGQQPPPTGASLPLPCWSIRLVPRADLLSPLYEGSVRTYGGDIRFVDRDPQADLLAATLGALYAHGAYPEPSYLRGLMGHDSEAVRRTVARLVGADATGFPSADETYDELDIYKKLARATRRAAKMSMNPHPYTPPSDVDCP